MGFSLSLLLILASLPVIFAQEDVKHATIMVDGTVTIAKTDENFICATLDWWPHDKCDYNQCPWGYSSVINLNLSQPLLAKAIQAFGHLRIRVGGSLQDEVIYDVGDLKYPCRPFQKMKYGLFGFSKGCLHMNRWDELNLLFRRTGAIVTFGLNALHGRHQIRRGIWGGAWDSANAYDFMKYTVSKGYKIDSWEFGNELSGSGVGASVNAELYGKDLINLKNIISDLYKNSDFKPSLVAPGGFFDQQWYAKLLQVSGSGIVNVLTHHIYNLGAGVDPNIVSKILDPHFLSKITETFSGVAQTIQQNGPWSSAWVGESGGAYNSGGRHVSNTFVNSFWYLDQLGLASKYNTKAYCRQTLVGGNYGLLNTTTLAPNPDYYSALLWNRLMGKGVLAVGSDASPYLRAYAHCTKGRAGVTLLLINLSNQTSFTISAQNSMTMELHSIQEESPFARGLKRSVSWIGNEASDESLTREEYHLTPKNGYLQSQTMLLNGIPLELTGEGDIPRLEPVHNNVKSPIYVSPLSISFVVFPNFDAPSCA
ncbi:heparanase-like protein 1 [Mercurialis annua]|uniref:heparanase-like protein 1 n=1 Tax=Mercurialis annua TaxID=3986 RepID=UPI00215DE9A1|nr:heparanase-like protein 1 [Mercurialis annua]XP_050224809.1 heparanase-like protein 1 [Mercurialis annua]XP_050224810.1 heparanase-like protein 1 [Mercurialis annua]